MTNQNNSSAPSEYCNQCSIERAAWILESYYAYLQRLSPINFDEHPYIPEIEGVAQDLRAMIAAAHPQQEGKAPVFDQAEFDTMVAAGTKAWAGVPDSFVEELRSNSPTTPTTPANAAAANGDGLTPIEPQNVSDERKSFDEYWNSLDSAGSTDAELEMCEYAAWQAWQARPRHCLALPLSLYPVGTTYGVAAADANGQKGDRNG